MGSRTIWDYEPDIPAEPYDDVSGKVAGAGGGGLAVFADLALKIGGLCERIDRQQDDWARLIATIPGDYQNAVAGAFPASGTLALDLGSPAQGTFWNVRRLIIGGADITTTPAGTGWVFVQGSPPNQNGANPSIAQAADITSGALPQKAFYGTHELAVAPGEHLWVIVVGGTNGTQYVASVKAETYSLTARISADFTA